MARLDTRYQSVWAYIYKKINQAFSKKYFNNQNRYHDYTDTFLDPDEDEVSESIDIKGQFLGTLQPINEMAKNILASFKPYKSTYDLEKDLRQPFNGIGNLAAALINLPTAIIVFAVSTVESVFSPTTFFTNMKDNVIRSASWIIESFTRGLHGAVQLTTTPLTWLLRIPFRFGLNRYYGWPKIEENNSVVSLISDGVRVNKKLSALENSKQLSLVTFTSTQKTLLKELNKINEMLKEKFLKAKERGQTTALRRDFFDHLPFKESAIVYSLADLAQREKEYFAIFFEAREKLLSEKRQRTHSRFSQRRPS